MRRLILLFIPYLLFCTDLLNFEGIESSEKDTSVYEFSFILKEDGDMLVMNTRGELSQGRVNIRFLGGGQELIGNYTEEGGFEQKNLLFGPLNAKDSIYVTITTNNAVGRWKVQFLEFSPKGSILSIIFSGIIIVLLIIIFIIFIWKRYIGVRSKWLAIGAGCWALGVALKFIFAILLNKPILAYIKDLFGQTGYLSLGSVYIGLLTGIFEIGITLIFALLIKGIYDSKKVAISVGIGAGTVEAFLIGLSQIGNGIMVLGGVPGTEKILSAFAQTALTTPLLIFIGPVERIIAVLCHIASRFLVLYAVARRRYIYFWAGFLILTGIDVIAGYFHLAGLVNVISLWWIEALLIPFAIVSILIIRWLMKNWEQGLYPSQNLS